MTSGALPTWLLDAVQASPLPEGAQVECETFASGAIALVVRHAGHLATVQATADRTEWGYSIDPADDDALTGHDATAPDVDTTLAAVADLLLAPERSPRR
ncbi:hypothetical protein [Actinomycetospora flava]|uniref:Uncharacterized protein n=1 Tax=Actinomycetospora flava TaxID=3129232 RepID=A0ABU8LZL6_9PSEU